LVVGGGPAGMEAATVTALKGHRVILYEKSKKLGGQLNLASTPPHKEELRNVISYFSYQLKKLKVKVVLGKEVNLRTVKRIKPDVIIVATGAVPIIPDIRGVKNKNVVTAWDVLAGKVEVGEKVVIVGGGMVGCETAEYLAEKGRKVTVIEMLPDIAIDMETFSRIFLLERLTQKNVRLMTNTKVKEITKNGVIIVNQREEILEADTVVLAVGSKPNTKLLEELEGKFPEVYAVGDCVEPRRCLEAIHEAWNVAFEL
jgi:NADPH-dependent 2,4-dienoyl-CoA reductase/sulfur reductase-like enzyme